MVFYNGISSQLRERLLHKLKKSMFIGPAITERLTTYGPNLELKKGPLLAHVNAALGSVDMS